MFSVRQLHNLQMQNFVANPHLVYVIFLCSPNSLHRVASYLCLLPELPEGQDTTYEKKVILELLVSEICIFLRSCHVGFKF